MKKDLKTRLVKRKVEKPDPFLMTVGFGVLGILNRAYQVKFHYDYDPKTIENQPTVMLSSHAARLEFLYTVYGFGRKDINMVCGYQNILRKGLYPLFLKLEVISKYLYQPDFLCVRNMFRVLARGGAIGLFPEGIQSTGGSLHPINPATTKFIKKSKANIVGCTTRGAYLATNRYSRDRKKGPIEVDYSLLFTPEMLETLTEEEIYARLLEAIRYNDFAYNKTARNKYVGKHPNAFGITKILYKCPACREEHRLSVEGDTILCGGCGFRAKVNAYYDLTDEHDKVYPFDIDQWYKWQRRCVAEQVKDDGFTLQMKGSLCTVRLDKLRKPPKDRVVLSVGTATLTNEGLTFAGTLNGEPADFEFPASGLYSLTVTTQNEMEFYHNCDYFMFIPEEQKPGLIQWTLAAEEIHNLKDEKWRSACEDVYEYDKGDLCVCGSAPAYK